MLCGIDPAYSGKGCGSLNYDSCLKILSRSIKESTKRRKKPIAKKVIADAYRKAVRKFCRKSTPRSLRPRNAPVFALSHSSGAVHFHKKNGFHTVAEIPFLSESSVEHRQNYPFYVTVLMLSMESEKIVWE